MSLSSAEELVFCCATWRSLFRPWRGTCLLLLKSHRHDEDQSFADMLQRLRLGEHVAGDISAINAT